MAERSKWDSYLIRKYHDERDALQKAVDALQDAYGMLREENAQLTRENVYLRGLLGIDPEAVLVFEEDSESTTSGAGLWVDVASGEVLDE